MTYRLCPNCKTKRPGREPELIGENDEQCRHCHGVDVAAGLKS